MLLREVMEAIPSSPTMPATLRHRPMRATGPAMRNHDDVSVVAPLFDAGADSHDDGAPEIPITDGPTEAARAPTHATLSRRSSNSRSPPSTPIPQELRWALTATSGSPKWMATRSGASHPAGTSGSSTSRHHPAHPTGSAPAPTTASGSLNRRRKDRAGQCRGEHHEFNIAPAVHGITAGPDGNIWFIEAHRVGRISTSGQNLTEFSFPANAEPRWSYQAPTEIFGRQI